MASTADPLTLEETARRVGGYAWIERRLFEITGRWVASVPEVEVKLLFGAQSARHGWHGELWFERLPELRELPRDDLVAAPHDALAGLLDEVATRVDTVERLVAVHRVLLPAVLATYTAHLDRVSPLADATVERVLGLVLADEVDDWRCGERLLQAMLTTPELVSGAAEHQREMQVRLLSGRASA